jgi:hypothetical protein
MNSFISHRLFVAAIGNDGRDAPKEQRNDPADRAVAPKAMAIPLELLDRSKPLPAAVTRPLRASHQTTA